MRYMREGMIVETVNVNQWYWFPVTGPDYPGIGHYVIVDADGTTVCNPSPMGQANAYLIAAAPEMLDALLDALPYVEDVLADSVALACFKPGTVQRHAAAIRAAIARATGAA